MGMGTQVLLLSLLLEVLQVPRQIRRTRTRRCNHHRLLQYHRPYLRVARLVEG
jgi:hypothetical protein